MEHHILSAEHMDGFSSHLIREEKSTATRKKYLRDIRAFLDYAGQRAVTKEVVLGWKQWLIGQEYSVRSVNSMLASVNSLLSYLGWRECSVKSVRIQHQIYSAEEKELSKAEYFRLLKASCGNERLNLILQTICATGIRVSELQFFKVEAVQSGEVMVRCKGKNRMILIPGKLRKMLLAYARRKKIRSGAIFISRNGKPLDRSNIWRQMKQLCRMANVEPSKVFPHNLRKLFARTFYGMERDIAKLADILGHSSINTTRIYIMTTGMEHRRKIERLGLIL